MVEIVNPQDAGLLAEACGSCNQHITVHELRRELRQIAEERDAAREQLAQSTFGPALDKLARDIVGVGADDVHPAEEIAVKWSRLREVLANPATTAEPAACICPTWREETPFGPQTMTGHDATCPVCGEKAEPADEPKATIRTALGDDWSNLLNDDEPECGHDRAKADDTECPECGADLAALDAEPAAS